jgi:hypothetical protein
MYLNIISNKELNKRIVAQINNDVELEMSAARYLGNLLIDVLNDPTGLKNWIDSEEHQKFKQTYKGDTCSAVKIYDEYRDKLDELLEFYTRTEIGSYLFHIFLTTKDNGNDVLLAKENTMITAGVNKANLQAFAKIAKNQGTLKSRLLKERVLDYISTPMTAERVELLKDVVSRPYQTAMTTSICLTPNQCKQFKEFCDTLHITPRNLLDVVIQEELLKSN